MKNKINIGTASIVLIFIVLCLSVFSLLSLSDAHSAMIFSKRRADSVTAYYQADARGQEFIRAAAKAFEGGASPETAAQNIGSSLPKDASVYEDEGDLVCEIAMTSGQSLYVKVDRAAQVLDYYVYNSEEYAIDTRLPVWTGEE